MALWSKKNSAQPASDPAPATAPTRVHAVRKLAEPAQVEDQPRDWFAVELTWTPADAGLEWAPAQLVAVEPGLPTDEATWGTVASARRWADGAWARADDARAGAQRVRLLLAVWPDGPSGLELRRGETVVAPLDLGRSRLGPALKAPERFDVPGECRGCQDMTLLNAEGRCHSCVG